MKSAREICLDGPDFDRIAFHKEFNAAMLAFLRKRLADMNSPD
jgi:hypothetical protein